MGSFSSTRLNLNRAQRRRLAAAAPAVDRITEADARYFARFPHRKHRLRPMGQAEHEQMLATGGQDMTAQDERWAVAVREIMPGARLRYFFRSARDLDLDQAETIAKATFDRLAAGNPQTSIVEAQVRAVMMQQHKGAP